MTITKFNINQTWTNRKGQKKSYLLEVVYSLALAEQERIRYQKMTDDVVEIEEVNWDGSPLGGPSCLVCLDAECLGDYTHYE